MDGMSIGTIAAAALVGCGLAASALWWFLGRTRPKVTTTARPLLQEVFVEVESGYQPQCVVLVRGVATKLRFLRAENASASEEIVLPHWQIRRTLPAFKTTTIDLQPDDIGEFSFHSGNGSLRGVLVVIAAPLPGTPADLDTSARPGA